MSSTEDVVAAIQRARNFLISEKGRNFLTEHLIVLLPSDPSAPAYALREVLYKIAEPPSDGQPHFLTRSNVRLEKSDTPDKNCSRNTTDPYPDAFVSEYAVGAEVCFNVRRLQRLPKDSLYIHALSLWVHEMTHLKGYGEPEAEAIGGLVLQAVLKAQSTTAEAILFSLVEILRGTGKHLAKAHLKRDGILKQDSGSLYCDKNNARAEAISPAQKDSLTFHLRNAASTLHSLFSLWSAVPKIEEAYAMDDRFPQMKENVNHLNRQIHYAASKSAVMIAKFSSDDSLSLQCPTPEIDSLTQEVLCLLKSINRIGDILKLPRANVTGIINTRENPDLVNCDTSDLYYFQNEELRLNLLQLWTP